MAQIYGNIAMFTGGPFSEERHVEMILKPSGPAVGGFATLWTEPIRITPDAAGNWTKDVVATVGLFPDVWYIPSVRWLDSGGNYISQDFPDWQVRVPAAGGPIREMIAFPQQADLGAAVWIGPEPPANKYLYTGWIDNSEPVPAEGMPFYEWE